MYGKVVSRVLGTLMAAGLVACGGNETPGADSTMAAAVPMAPAEYTVVIKSRWTAANHPLEYPAAGALTGPHFSGAIGAAHNGSFSLFSEGVMPSPGLERLSEEGKHDPLNAEIEAAVAAGSAANLFESDPLRNFADSIVTTVRVDEAHPMVSLAMMIAPSPDWFTGVANVSLMENGAWVPSRALDLVAWDSGGDDGATYKAADRDNVPKKPASMASTAHFVINGAAVPVGSVTFTRR